MKRHRNRRHRGDLEQALGPSEEDSDTHREANAKRLAAFMGLRLVKSLPEFVYAPTPYRWRILTLGGKVVAGRSNAGPYTLTLSEVESYLASCRVSFVTPEGFPQGGDKFK